MNIDEPFSEITIELTDYCPERCSYCSSRTTTDYYSAKWIDFGKVHLFLECKHLERIILSGGEPLAHPDFYRILQMAKKHAKDVVVYTNAITHICYNANVIDGIYVAANLTINDSTAKVKILKRVDQGRESTRPEVSFSGNFDGRCPCNSPVMLPDGEIMPSPCNKENETLMKIEDMSRDELEERVRNLENYVKTLEMAKYMKEDDH